MTRFGCALGLGCLLLCVVVAGCQDPTHATEIVVRIDAPLSIRTELNGVDFKVLGGAEGGGREERLGHSLAGAELEWPIHIVVVPRDNDPSRVFEVVAEGAADDTPMYRVRAVTGFVPEQTRYLTLSFTEVCRKRLCGPEETCVDGTCASARLSAAQLPTSLPEQAPDDGTGPSPDPQPDDPCALDNGGCAAAARCEAVAGAPVCTCPAGSDDIEGDGTVCTPVACEPGEPLCDGLCSPQEAPESADCDGLCQQGDAASGPDCDGLCQQGDAASGPDCDGRCALDDAPDGPDCDTRCQVGDSAPGPDCDDRCDPGELPNSSDCDATCGAGETSTSPDCDGACVMGDDAMGADCDGACDANDGLNSPDCDGQCDADDADQSADCGGGCQDGDTAGGASCDGLCAAADSAGGPDCDGVCREGEAIGSPDCDRRCAEQDAANGPDCDGACQAGEASTGADCDGRCDVVDADPSADCDGTCDANDAAASADCGGRCDPSDAAAGPDCDGACGTGDAAQGADCDGSCDMGDLAGGVDCDGVCQVGDAAGGADCDGTCDTTDVADSADCPSPCVKQPTLAGCSGPVIPTVSVTCPTWQTGTISFMGLDGIQLVVGPMPSQPTAPMVFYWHGTGGSSSEFTSTAPAVRDGVVAGGGVLVSFQGTTGGDTLSGTNVFGAGDLNLVDQLVACAVRDRNVDPRRIFTTGCSGGGIFATNMAIVRSNYVAATAPNSGGLTMPNTFQNAFTPALMTIHGAAGLDVVLVDFSETSATANQTFAGRGGFVVTCDHGGGHCGGRALASDIWAFFQAHHYGAIPEPWAAGLPPTTSSACRIY